MTDGHLAPVNMLSTQDMLTARMRYVLARLVFGGCLCLGFVPVCVAEVPGGEQIGVRDLVEIKVFGEATVSQVLSGNFRVAPDGTISYPILGSVTVVGKSPAEVVEMILNGLGTQVPISGTPTVSVAQYAPVFLLGDIGRTGPIEYQPGMTVFELVLQAGGLPRSAQDDSKLRAAAHDLAELELQKFALMAKRARLQAEVQDRPFSGTELVIEGSNERARIAANEVAIFEAHARALNAQTKGYEAQLQAYEKEIEFLDQSIALHDEEVSLMDEQYANQETLAERGLTPRSNLIDLKRRLAVIGRESLEFRTALYQAHQKRLDTEQKLSDADLSADTKNHEELSTVERDLALTLLQLEETKEILAQVPPEDNVEQGALGRIAAYTLIRRDPNGEHVVQPADEATLLRRGDILRVELPVGDAEQPVRAASSDAQRSSLDLRTASDRAQ